MERPPRREATREMEDTPERRAAFRISIFGTGSEVSGEDKRAMQYAREVAGGIVEKGFSIATGGYDIGVMKAANDAAIAKAKTMQRRDTVAKNFPLPKKEFPALSYVKSGETRIAKTRLDRLKHLLYGSTGFVVLSGGFGTTVEMINALHNLPKESPKPLIIIDPTLRQNELLEYLHRQDSSEGKQSHRFLHTYFLPGTNTSLEKAHRIIELYYQRSLGSALPQEDEEFLRRNNFHYLSEHWLEEAEAAGYHF